MIKRVLLLSILFVLLSRANVFASQTNNNDTAEVVISQSWRSQEDTSGRLFFLFAEAEFPNIHLGRIIAFKSEIIIDSPVEGDLFAFFSQVKISENGKVSGNIYSISSLIEIEGEKDYSIVPLAFWEGRLFGEAVTEEGLVYDSRLPAFVFMLLFCVCRQLLCFVIYGAKPGFFNQGSMILEQDAQDIIQFGLTAYALVIAMAIVFLLSVVGVIITFIIIALAFVITMLGQVSLEISLGNMIVSNFNGRLNPYKSMLIGGIIFEATVFIPLIGFTANFLFLPILCMGIFSSNIVNGFYRKRYFETPFDKDEEVEEAGEANKNSEKIRNIIIGK